jgi:hypothetical protein
MSLKHTKSSAKADGGDATVVQPSDWNAEHYLDSTQPTTPAATKLGQFVRTIANRDLPGWVDSFGNTSAMQPFWGRNKVGYWAPIGNATTVPLADGIAAPVSLGTATARTVATTNFVTRLRRLGYVSAATAAAAAGFRANVAQFTVGGGAVSPLVGGFHFVCRFVPSDAAAVSGARMFVGMTATTAALANAEPNTYLNCVGVAQLSTSSNLHIVYGGSAAQTAIDLGANFPANGISTSAYELSLYADKSENNKVYYRVERMNTADVATGTLTAATPGTQLPSSTTLLGPQGWRCNNATLLAVGIDLVSLYLETDN